MFIWAEKTIGIKYLFHFEIYFYLLATFHTSFLSAFAKMFCVCEEYKQHFLSAKSANIFYYGSTLTNKYCKTGVRERLLLLRNQFIKASTRVH